MKSTCLALALLLTSILTFAQLDSLQNWYKQGMTAKSQARTHDAIHFLSKANAVRPHHPIILYQLAHAEAMASLPYDAIQTLTVLQRMDASKDFAADSSFVSLWSNPDFQKVHLLRTQASTPVIKSELAIALPQQEHHFESIARHRDEWLLGTVNSRMIFSVKDGQPSLLSSDPRLFAVMGLDVDEANGVLWICTAALPEMRGFHDSLANQSSVLAIDLQSREVIASFVVKDALLGDLILHDGKIYASDGRKNNIYTFDRQGLVAIHQLPQLLNLQGLTMHPNGRQLYLSDYLTGIYSYHLETRQLTKLVSNDLISEKGIDGLLYRDGWLIAFQNGTTPKRALALQLDSEGLELTQCRIIDQALPTPGEPTQGAWLGPELYYLATSAWQAYESGTYDSSATAPLEIRKINWEAITENE